MNSWVSEVKQYKETMANKQRQNGRGEYKIDKIGYVKGGVTLNAYIYTQRGREIEK